MQYVSVYVNCSERFVTGLITTSMLVSLLGQYSHMVPGFTSMKISQLLPLLVPHRLVIVDSNAIVPQAYWQMVVNRVTGAAVVDQG